MSEKYRALIVDDEWLAREDLARQLRLYPQIEIVGEADSVESAAKMITTLQPDVVFLDIQMPRESGFKLFDKVEIDFQVIFVTAFDNYAIRAFEVNALDYLLKPVSSTRLEKAILRLSASKSSATLNRLNYDDYIFIKANNHTGFVKLSSILYIKAVGDYTEVYLANGGKRMLLKSVREWEEHLPSQYFLRIHRSTIINIEYTEKIEPWFRSTYQVYLRNVAEPFPTSRKYASELRKKIF